MIPEFQVFRWYEESPPAWDMYTWAIWDNNGDWLAVNDGEEIDSSEGLSYDSIHPKYWIPVDPQIPLRWLCCAECNNISYLDYLCSECRSDD